MNHILDSLSGDEHKDVPCVKEVKEVFSKYALVTASSDGKPKDDSIYPGRPRDEVRRLMDEIRKIYKSDQYDNGGLNMGIMRELLTHGRSHTHIDPDTKKREHTTITTYLVEKDKMDLSALKDTLKKVEDGEEEDFELDVELYETGELDTI